MDECLIFGLFREIQAEVAGALFEGWVLGQIAETRDLQIVAHLLQHLEMTGGTHLIKYDACYADILSEVDKAREQSCRRAIRPLAIVVLPEPLVGAAMRNAVLGVIIIGFVVQN